MNTQTILASNISLLIANDIDTQQFLTLSPKDAQAQVDALTAPTDELDIFDIDDDIVVETEDSEPLGVIPARKDFADNEEFYSALVAWLTHKDQEPVILNTTIKVGSQELTLNGHRLNTEFSLMNKGKNDKMYYRLDEIKYCCIVLKNGADKVNDAQVIKTKTAIGYTNAGSLNGFDIEL